MQSCSTGSAPETAYQNAAGKMVSGGVSTGLDGVEAGAGKRVYTLKTISNSEWQYIPRNRFVLSAECREWIEGQAAAGQDTRSWYVLQEAISVLEENITCESKKAYSGLKQLIGVGGGIESYTGCTQTNRTTGLYAFKAIVVSVMTDAASPAIVAVPPPANARVGLAVGAGIADDADIVSDVSAITAQLKQAAALKERLATERQACLQTEAKNVQAQAKSTWAVLAELRRMPGDAALPKVQAFIKRYTNATAICTDPEGRHEEAVAISPCAYKRWYFRQRRCECSTVSSRHAGGRHSRGLLDEPWVPSAGLVRTAVAGG